MLTLRPYQEESVDSIFDWLFNKVGNPIVGLPTGTGKSIVIAEFLRRLYSWYPQSRVMVLTHVKELVQQNYAELLELWPTAPAGVYSAGLKRKDTHFPITFCGIASVAKATHKFTPIHIVVVDECHMINNKQATLYQKTLEALKVHCPGLRVIGLTATPYRLGMGLLTEGGIFAGMCIDYTSFEKFNQLVDEGYICPLIPRRTVTELDVSGVAVQGGEFVQSELQAVVDVDSITRRALAEAIELGKGRRHWLVFCTSVEHADHVRDILCEFGIPAVSVHSQLPGGDAERDANIKSFKQGLVGAMVGVGIFTTGFNFKPVDFILVLRPTMSPILWVQLLGRGTRVIYADGYCLETAEDRRAAIAASYKPNCLVLDFAANTKRLGPINDPVIPKKKGKKASAAAPYKVCPSCQTYNHTRARFCVYCQAEFPQGVKIDDKAAEDELIRREKPVEEVHLETFTVDRVTYSKHQRRDQFKPPSLKANFYCGRNVFQKFICLEHDGYAKKLAHTTWTLLTTAASVNLEPTACPETVDEALQRQDELIAPIAIRVVVRPKFPDIVEFIFTDERDAPPLENPNPF